MNKDTLKSAKVADKALITIGTNKPISGINPVYRPEKKGLDGG